MIYARAEVIRSTRRDDGCSTSCLRHTSIELRKQTQPNLLLFSTKLALFWKTKGCEAIQGFESIRYPREPVLTLHSKACTASVRKLNPLITSLESAGALSQQPENHGPQTPLNLRPSSSIRHNFDTVFGIPIPEIRQRELQVQYSSQQST